MSHDELETSKYGFAVVDSHASLMDSKIWESILITQRPQKIPGGSRPAGDEQEENSTGDEAELWMAETMVCIKWIKMVYHVETMVLL